MSYDFADATYVPQTGGGRTAEPNPFTDVVAAIALKRNADDTPVAKAFTETTDGTEEANKKATARIKRLMTLAGEAVTPEPVTVRVDVKPGKKVVGGKATSVDDPKQLVITFWTVKKQRRPRTASASASSVQAEAVATPDTVSE